MFISYLLKEGPTPGKSSGAICTSEVVSLASATRGEMKRAVQAKPNFSIWSSSVEGHSNTLCALTPGGLRSAEKEIDKRKNPSFKRSEANGLTASKDTRRNGQCRGLSKGEGVSFGVPWLASGVSSLNLKNTSDGAAKTALKKLRKVEGRISDPPPQS